MIIGCPKLVEDQMKVICCPFVIINPGRVSISHAARSGVILKTGRPSPTICILAAAPADKPPASADYRAAI
jgi:hypothetical protein